MVQTWLPGDTRQRIQDSLDLRRITAEYLTGAVMRAVSIADIPEAALPGLGSAFKTVLDEMRNSAHNK